MQDRPCIFFVEAVNMPTATPLQIIYYLRYIIKMISTLIVVIKYYFKCILRRFI
jgi:hypothetical protein